MCNWKFKLRKIEYTKIPNLWYSFALDFTFWIQTSTVCTLTVSYVNVHVLLNYLWSKVVVQCFAQSTKPKLMKYNLFLSNVTSLPSLLLVQWTWLTTPTPLPPLCPVSLVPCLLSIVWAASRPQRSLQVPAAFPLTCGPKTCKEMFTTCTSPWRGSKVVLSNCLCI